MIVTIEVNGTLTSATGALFHNNDPFNITWTFNTDCACAFQFGDSIAGGSFDGSASPVISAVLSIDTFSFDFGPGIYGGLQGHADTTLQNVTVQPGISALTSFIESTTTDGRPINNFPHSMTTPFTYTFNPETDNLRTGGIGGGFLYANNSASFHIGTIELINPLYHTPGPVLGSGPLFLALLLVALLWRRK